MRSSEHLLYHESQRFTQWWVWFFVLLPFAIGVYGLYQQVYLGITFGNKPFSNTGLFVFTAIGLAIAVFVRYNQLNTRIYKNRIEIQYYPYFTKIIFWKDVETMECIDYGFVGGWGIRLTIKYGTIYNVRGREGLAIHLKNKQKLVVGTQQRKRLEKSIPKIPITANAEA